MIFYKRKSGKRKNCLRKSQLSLKKLIYESNSLSDLYTLYSFFTKGYSVTMSILKKREQTNPPENSREGEL